MESTPLSPVKPLQAFWETHRQFFPSEGSLSWFVREHKAQLVKSGALLLMRGSWNVNETVFEQTMVEIARADAAKWVDKFETRPAAA
ncbi:MAG: hypothetical protein Q8R33_00385 [Burkholderiales bacterium]|nr:hypothetical protein [Burkholderiales bacterium]